MAHKVTEMHVKGPSCGMGPALNGWLDIFGGKYLLWSSHAIYGHISSLSHAGVRDLPHPCHERKSVHGRATQTIDIHGRHSLHILDLLDIYWRESSSAHGFEH